MAQRDDWSSVPLVHIDPDSTTITEAVRARAETVRIRNLKDRAGMLIASGLVLPAECDHVLDRIIADVMNAEGARMGFSPPPE